MVFSTKRNWVLSLSERVKTHVSVQAVTFNKEVQNGDR